MAKGNYTALNQLKPAEIKVGEFYNKNFVEPYIKNGESERAVQAKLAQEKRKEIGDRFNSMKLDPFSTLTNFSDFSQKSLIETADYIGTMRMMAEKDPANASAYLMKADNAYNDYRGLASTFGSKDFIDKANAKQQALASNDVFSETDNNEQLAILGQAIPEYRRDPNTGRMKFGLPKSGVATDGDNIEWKSAGEIAGLWTAPDEINLLKSNKSNGNNGFLDKQVFDVAKQMSDEYSRNYDGNRTNAKTWFSEERGKLWFDTNFGEFNPNNINPIVKQYAKSVLRKSINGDDAEAVFNEAKAGIVNSVAALVGREEKVETKDSALDIAVKKQQLENARLEGIKKRQEIANPGGGSGSSGGSGGFSSVSPSMVNKSDKVIVQIRGNNGEVIGNQLWAANTVPLPKVKGYPSTVNTFGLSNFTNKKGEKVPTIIMGAPADDGKMVYSKISPSDFSSYVSKSGYDPYSVLQNLQNKNTTMNRYTGQVDKSKPIYQKVKVGYQAKEVKGDDDNSIF